MAFATRNRRPPRTLTDAEVKKLLKVSGEHVAGFRDHLIFSFALGCALREGEIVGLDVEDVARLDGKKLVPKRTVHLRVFKGRDRWNIDPSTQRVPLTDSTYYKVEKYLKTTGWTTGPLFRSRNGGARLSTKSVRTLFAKWQAIAGFDHPYSFHHLRHTSLTNIYREKRDVRYAQSLARHVNLQTTSLYTHVSDEEMIRAVKGLAS